MNASKFEKPVTRIILKRGSDPKVERNKTNSAKEKGPVQISGARVERNKTNSERILELLKADPEKGIDSGQLVKVTGIKRNTIGSVLVTLEKVKKIHKRKKVGVRGYTYFYGREDSNSPTAESIAKVIKGLDEQMRDMSHHISQVKGCLKAVREHTLRLERIREDKDRDLAACANKYEKLEKEHIELLQRLEDLLK